MISIFVLASICFFLFVFLVYFMGYAHGYDTGRNDADSD